MLQFSILIWGQKVYWQQVSTKWFTRVPTSTLFRPQHWGRPLHSMLKQSWISFTKAEIKLVCQLQSFEIIFLIGYFLNLEKWVSRYMMGLCSVCYWFGFWGFKGIGLIVYFQVWDWVQNGFRSRLILKWIWICVCVCSIIYCSPIFDSWCMLDIIVPLFLILGGYPCSPCFDSWRIPDISVNNGNIFEILMWDALAL